MTGLDRFTRILDWNLLKYFIQIARSGGIGAAAGAMHVSQPSVSAALRKLEDQLGVRLFVRTRKGVELTAAGKFLNAECEKMAESLAGVPQNLRAITGKVAGTVLVKSISHVFSPALDAGLIAFKHRYPDVELILETAPWEVIVTSLLSGDSAVAIGFDEVQRTELCHALLTREKIQIYCGPSHHLYGKPLRDPRELGDEPFIAFSEGEPATLRNFRDRYHIGRKVSGHADNVYEAWWLIKLGIGIGMLPVPTAEAMATGEQLCALLPDAETPELDIYMMWRPDLQDRATQLLVQTILEHIEPARSAPAG